MRKVYFYLSIGYVMIKVNKECYFVSIKLRIRK